MSFLTTAAILTARLTGFLADEPASYVVTPTNELVIEARDKGPDVTKWMTTKG